MTADSARADSVLPPGGGCDCRATGGDLSSSGRCLTCEAAADIPEADHTSLRQIGHVANLVGLSLQTVRHYEDAGLVRPVGRTAGGFRVYDDDAIERLRLIMQMKPFGFSLEEMRLLIDTTARLGNPDIDEQARADLEDRLTMFALSAAEKCRQLRHQLAIAEAFAATLSRSSAGTRAGSATETTGRTREELAGGG